MHDISTNFGSDYHKTPAGMWQSTIHSPAGNKGQEQEKPSISFKPNEAGETGRRQLASL